MNGHITISIDGIEIGNWGTEDANSVMGRFAAFVADRTNADVDLGGHRTVCDGANIEAADVDGMLWDEFCSGHNDADFLAKYGPDADESVPSVQCQCGQWSGEACQWSGPESETVTVEFMPEHLRASHEAAGNSGSYPHNGAVRIRVERSCAALMAKTDGQWVSVPA